MKNLKVKLEAVQYYYESENIFQDVEERKLKDGKNTLEYHGQTSPLSNVEERKLKDYRKILEYHRQTSPLLDDACKGRINLVEEVDKLWEVVTKKHKGFLNSLKAYRNLDENYNKQVEDLENALDYKSKKMKTGGNKTEQVVRYVGRELGTDATLAGLGSIALVMVSADMLFPFVSWGLGILYLGSGIGAKLVWTPSTYNKGLRKEDFQNMKETAEVIQPVIEKIYTQPITEKGSVKGK